MSKWAAIDTAVRLQLAEDGKVIDYKRKLGTDPAPPANPDQWIGYDAPGLQQFLLRVADRMRLDKPALTFAWRNVKATDCLDMKPGMLVSVIETETKDPDAKSS